MARTVADTLREVTEEMTDLATRGQRIAFGLMAINNVTADHNSTLNSVVCKLFALVGVSNLLKDLLKVGSRDKDPVLPLLTLQDLRHATDLLQTWKVALLNVGPLIIESDTHIYSQRFRSPTTGPPNCRFPEIAMANSLVRISDCLKGFSLLVSSARIQELQRQFSGNYSTGNDTLESESRKEEYRLVETTQSLRRQNDRTSVLGTGPPLLQSQQSSGGVFGFQTQAPSLVSLNPSQTYTAVDIKELQHPRGFRGRYGEPDYPFLDKRPHVQLNPPEFGLTFNKSFEECELERRELSRKGKYPESVMFSNWPPAFVKNTVQGPQEVPEKLPEKSDSKAQISQTIEKSHEQVTKEADSTPRLHREVSVDTKSEFEVLSHSEAGVNTPNTTRDNTPVPEPKSGTPVKEEESRQDQKTVMPVSATTQKSNGPQPIKEDVATSTEKADFEDVMEAYMLTPCGEQIRDIVEWSTKIHKMPLEPEQVAAHVKKLGKKYSVIDTIANISPEEWRTIRAYAKPRSGTVVSIQRSHMSNMPTMLGVIAIPSLMFVMKIPKIPSNIRSGDNASIASEPSSQFGGFRGGLFGRSQPNTMPSGFFGTKPEEEEHIGMTRRPSWDPEATNGFANTGRLGGLFGSHQPTSSLFGNPSSRQPSLFSNFSNARPSLFANTTSSTVENAQPMFHSMSNDALPSPFSNFQNAQPSRVSNSQNVRPSPLSNVQPTACSNPQPSPFSQPNNNQRTGGLFGSLFGATPRQPAQHFSNWGVPVSKPASASTGGLFATLGGVTTAGNTSSGGFGANSARNDAPNTSTADSKVVNLGEGPKDLAATAGAESSQPKAPESKKEGPRATPVEGPDSNISPSAEWFDELLSTPFGHVPSFSLFTPAPPNPQPKPSLFGTPSLPGAETPKPFGTPPSSGPFAQYAGPTSAFATSAPEKQESVFTKKTSEPVKGPGPARTFGRKEHFRAGPFPPVPGVAPPQNLRDQRQEADSQVIMGREAQDLMMTMQMMWQEKRIAGIMAAQQAESASAGADASASSSPQTEMRKSLFGAAESATQEEEEVSKTPEEADESVEGKVKETPK
ncbi:hypothetical protein BU16DRAFT_537175 [Lophium mytilinum]|uniref:Uncharacterized protein n=1 Tax=Lophium mytilinum TaxID=390894 RepID=A0A6A6QZ21_9PEZI|nr:hypothetical protein BU16DRAFT_537175 [Lophium mytilinum]